MKSCSKCGGSLGERLGKQSYCKKCHAGYMRATRPKHSELKPDARKKATARAYTNVYIKRGIIKKMPCFKCGDEKVEAHHHDYNKPLEVTWLCRKCHLELHRATA